MYITFEYQRVPDLPFLWQTTKGRPNPAILYDYHRGEGFVEWTKQVKPYAKGGATQCYIFGDSWMLAGMATCSMSDTFSYQEGKELAFLRATNLGLGHELDSGLMFRLDDKFSKWMDQEKADLIVHFLSVYITRFPTSKIPNTAYFHPETALIVTKNSGFNIKMSKIILKNHVWIGFEE